MMKRVGFSNIKTVFLFFMLATFSVVCEAYDFYMKNKDGVNICYNIVSSELYNRKVEVAKSDERYEKPIVIPSTVNSDGRKYKVTGIGEEAFYGQSKITSVTFPSTLEYIGSRAFMNCLALVELKLPNTVTDVGYDAFYDTGIKTPVYSDSLFAYCPWTVIGDYEIPDGIVKIASGSFARDRNLFCLTIPKSVRTIERYAFVNEDSLRIREMYVKALEPPLCDDLAFNENLYDRTTIYVSNESPVILERYKNSEGWKNFKSIVAIEMKDNDKLPCDVNGDGVVNSADVVSVYNYIANGALSFQNIVDVDLNGDGNVNASDVVMIYNCIIMGE